MLWAGGQCRCGYGCGWFSHVLAQGPIGTAARRSRPGGWRYPAAAAGGCGEDPPRRRRPPALGAEGSWRRLCGARNARIAAAHPHCTGPSSIAASPHRTFTRGDCFQDRQPKARDERSGQGRRQALALALTASEAALTLPLLEQSPTPSGTIAHSFRNNK